MLIFNIFRSNNRVKYKKDTFRKDVTNVNAKYTQRSGLGFYKVVYKNPIQVYKTFDSNQS